MRHLLIDDSPIILHVLRAYLRQYGECDLARSGAEGLAAFTRGLDEERSYDLICLDLQMPDLDGAAVLTRIRKLEEDRQTVKRAKVLVVSATNEAAVVAKVIAAGADSYLLKPIDPGPLKERLLALGLIGSATEIRVRGLVDQLEALCAADEIPPPHLKEMMRIVSTALERQASKNRKRPDATSVNTESRGTTAAYL